MRDLLETHELLVAGVLVAFGLGIAVARAASTTDTIHTCLKPAGPVRIIDDGKSCKGQESALSWSAQGPARARRVRPRTPGRSGSATE